MRVDALHEAQRGTGTPRQLQGTVEGVPEENVIGRIVLEETSWKSGDLLVMFGKQYVASNLSVKRTSLEPKSAVTSQELILQSYCARRHP